MLENLRNKSSAAEIERAWIETGWGDGLPSEEKNREFLCKISEFTKQIERNFFLQFPQFLGRAEFTLQGSVAKGTFLENPDVDLFILCSEEDFASISKAILEFGRGKEHFLKFTQHTYIQLIYNGIPFDLVPCIRILKDQLPITKVDRTPLHTLYVKENLDEEGIQDVLKLKILLKKTRNYSSKTSHGGMIGFALEVLRAKKKGIVGLQEYFTSEEFTLNPFLPDPTDTLEKRNLLKSTTRRYRERIAYVFSNLSSIDYFLSTNIEGIEKKIESKTFLKIRFSYRKNFENIVSSQLLKMEESLFRTLEPFGLVNITPISISVGHISLVLELALNSIRQTTIKYPPRPKLIPAVASYFRKERNISFTPEGSREIIVVEEEVERIVHEALKIKTKMKIESLDWGNLDKEEIVEIAQNSKMEWFSHSIK